jgi:RNA polymerase sigma-70 factor (sigma-E family)
MPEVADHARRDGFAAVYARHAPGAYRLALRLCGDPSLAEDVVADAAAKVLVSWRGGRIDDDGAYLRRAVVNRLRSVQRRQAVERRWRDRRSGDHRGDLPFTQRSDHADLFAAALKRLTFGQRAVVVLRYYEGLSEAEIARVLGCSRGTVKSQASRALARLRDLVGPTIRDEEGTP